MILCQNLNFSWGRQKIVENLSFRVETGECLVLAGANGAGKTTLLSILAGIVPPASGTVKTDGKIGYVPQGSALLEDATVAENLRFFSDLARVPVPDPEKLPFAVRENLKKRVSKLSGGMKKQVSIACALVSDPPVLLLDEPCAALDLPFCEDMIALVQQWKKALKTVVYVGHNPAEFEPFYDRILFLSNTPLLVSREEIAGQAFRDFYLARLKESKEE